MDIEEIVMLTRSILASKKHAITLSELQREYFELNGTRLPFRNIGFDSLVAFLQNFPDKFCLLKNDLNEITIKATIDPEMQALAKLVAGQRTDKKKKKSKSKKKPKSNHFQQHQPQQPKKKFYDNFDTKNTNSQKIVQFRFRPYVMNSINQVLREDQVMDARPVSKWESSTSFSSDGNSPCRQIITNENQAPVQSISKQIITKNKSKNLNDKRVVTTSPFIENASYFLKEAQVYVCLFETCETVYIRLIGEMFSLQYDKLNTKLNQDYKKTKSFLDKPEIDQFCVAYDKIKDTYHRVQIKKIEKKKVVCFYLDEGLTNTFNTNELFVLKDEYLSTKFQAVKVEMLSFDQFKNNEYVLKLLQNEYTNKTYVARRYQAETPVKITLYNSANNCINETLLKSLVNFIPIQLSVDQQFSATISYIDEESKLVYLLFEDEFKEKFDTKMMTINKYFLEKPQQTNQAKLTNLSINESQGIICFARYVDSIWYRAKILRKKSTENTVLVHFIDFGNKELISTQDIRLIETSFSYLKHLPPQATPAFVLNQENHLNELKEYMYDAQLVAFRVLHVNNSGVATVDVSGLCSKSTSCVDSSTSSDTESDDDNEGDIESDECCAQIIQNLNLNLNPNEIVNLRYSELEKATLQDGSFVYVVNQNHPTDFSICTDTTLIEFESFQKSMQEFYSQNESNFRIKEPIAEDGIYVYKDDNNEYHRIKAFMSLRGVRVYRIDTGSYDVTKPENMFYITRRFTQFKPSVFRASLAKIKYDRIDNWSQKAKDYFRDQINDKLLQVKVFEKINETETYKVDLLYLNELISSRLIQQKLANPI